MKEYALPAAREHHVATSVILLYQLKIDAVDLDDLFQPDAVFTDPITTVVGTDKVREVFRAMAEAFEPDVDAAAGEVASQATEMLSIQPAGDLGLKILMEKRYRLTPAAVATFTGVDAGVSLGPEGPSPGTITRDNRFTLATTVHVTLDPYSHKVRTIVDQWDIQGMREHQARSKWCGVLASVRMRHHLPVSKDSPFADASAVAAAAAATAGGLQAGAAHAGAGGAGVTKLAASHAGQQQQPLTTATATKLPAGVMPPTTAARQPTAAPGSRPQ